MWPLRVYRHVMRDLHSQLLSTAVTIALTVASVLGVIAFLEQCLRVFHLS